jgi:hypothetical protein
VAVPALVLAFWLTCCGPKWAAGAARPASPAPAGGAGQGTVGLLVLSEKDADVLPSAAALTRRLSGAADLTVLLVSAGTVGRPAEGLLLRQLRPRRCLLLSRRRSAPGPLDGATPIDATAVELSPCPTRAGLEIAERFWGTAQRVVVARTTNRSAVLLGSALAGHLGVPFVPLGDDLDRAVVASRLARMKVGQLLAVTSSGDGGAVWPNDLAPQSEVLDLRQATERLVRTLGPEQVRNIIVVRAPDSEPSPSPAAQMAAYLSLVRRAPIVFCSSAEGRQVESDVLAFIKAHGLDPQTITLLGDDQALGTILLADPGTLGDYVVDIEPCSGPADGGAAAYGVGRIAQTSVADASLLIARGIARERIVGRRRFRMLMIANPQTEYGTLPFAETVSRVTAEEFKNVRLSVDEFYGTPADAPEIVRAVTRAHLIVFEGHVTDQLLFEDPTFLLPTDEEDVPAMAAGAIVDPNGPPGQEPWRPATWTDSAITLLAEALRAAAIRDIPDEVPPEAALPHRTQRELSGLPLVILQSCHSLDPAVAETVFSQGGVALLGTTTNVHSASGSSFVKAYCDGMLYRGRTVGEALRDARNYFLCLAKLKAQRKHKEQAKTYRAAMSFCLWGDPEVAVLPRARPRGRLAPVSAAFLSPDTVRITTPARLLPECRTSAYVTRMFPGSQAAGIVKRLKGKERRRLMPTYFFVLPAPRRFVRRQYARLQGEGDAAERSVFVMHPAGHTVYLLHFPSKDRRRGEIMLQFVR